MAIKRNYSFLKGCNKVSREDYNKLQTELKDYLGCSTMQYYYKKRKAFPDIPAHIKDGIETIFNSYGIPASEVWEITDVADGTE